MRSLGVWGAIFGLTGVAAGAFGAHALRERIAPDMLTVFETGARYQLIHAVAIVALALAGAGLNQRAQKGIGVLWICGTLIFSGSLYTLATTGQRALGAITPIGGLFFLAGWAWLAVAFWQSGESR